MIKVMIERHLAEDLAELYQQKAGLAMQTAMNAKGFISGESLRNNADPNHRIIFANFHTLDDWLTWYRSPERKEVIALLRPMLLEDEKITLLEHI